MTALISAVLGTWRGRLILGAFAVLAVAGVVRSCNPPPPARVAASNTLDASTVQLAAAATSSTSSTDRVTKRTETRPDGARIETETTEHVDAGTSSTASTATAAQLHQVQTLVVEAARADWRLTAAALWRPRDLTAAPPVLHGELLRRLAGPVWVGPAVSYDRQRRDLTAGVAVSVEW